MLSLAVCSSTQRRYIHMHKSAAALGRWRRSGLWAPCCSAARSVKAVPIRIVTVAKGNSQGAQLMAGEWADKLQRYVSLSTVQIKPNPQKTNSSQAAVEAEGQRVLKQLKPEDRVVALDERGRHVTSHQIADLIAEEEVQLQSKSSSDRRVKAAANSCASALVVHMDTVMP